MYICSEYFKDKRYIEGMQNIADALNDHFVNIAKTAEKSQFNAENFISLQRFLDMKLQNSSFDIDFIKPPPPPKLVFSLKNWTQISLLG